MKKIFTLLGGLLLATSLNSKAEEVTVMIMDNSYNQIADSYTTELTKDAAGNWTLADFLESEMPISFKFEKPAAGGSSMMTLTSPSFVYEGSENMPYICDANDNYPTGWIYNYNNNESWVEIQYPYLYLDDWCFNVYGYDLSNPDNEYEYFAYIAVSGSFYTYNAETEDYTAFEKDPWIYIGFYFNEPKEEENPETPADSINVTVNLDENYYYPDYSDYENYSEKPLKSFDANLEIGEDGTYTLKNIFNTDYSISYTIGNFNPNNIALVTFTGNIDEEDYFLTPAGKYMHVTVEDESGETQEVKFLYGTAGKDYSYVEKTTDEEGNVLYDVCLNVSGFVNNNTGLFDMYLAFSYSPKTNAVSFVEINENAPVEYYNLQGVKVAEPSNGIFIRRQGSKTTKVAIK